MAMLVCTLSSANVWMCGIQERPAPQPTPPPITTPVAPTPQAPVVTVPPGDTGPGAQPTPSNPAGNDRPGDLIDLKNWYLTLPTGSAGSPDTVKQPNLSSYSSSYFQLNQTRDGVVFTANAGGTTTKNSKYPRSELREMSGSEMAAWSNTSGTHTLSARQAVTALPPAKPEIVTAQIHGGDDDVMQVRLEDTRLMAQYDDGKSEIVMDPDYRLGTVFDVKIVAAEGRVVVYYNGAAKAQINQSGSGWYFKSGSYLQSNPGKGDQASATGEVVIYSLNVTHSG
jgi:hypothetical protein